MISSTIKKAAVLAVASVLVFAGASTSMAASKVAVDLPNEAVAGGESVAVPFTLTGFTFANITATLSVDAGTLTVADAGSLLTLNAGYSSLVDQTEISFHGAAADVNTILGSGVTWTAPGDATTTTELKLRAEIGEFVVGQSYDPTTGHTYKFVNTGLNWESAQAAAKAMTFKGKAGYLANITSASENTFVANKSGANDVWFGGTTDQRMINFALTAAGKPTTNANTQSLGYYYWGAGPEVGTQFGTGLNPNVGVNGAFVSWANGEPNNGGGGNEACAVTNWSGGSGMWNDLDCGRTQSYLVEFDTTAADFASAVSVFDNVTGNSVDAVPAPVEEVPVVDDLANTGFDAALLLGLALALIAAGSLVVVRARKN